MGSYLSVDVGGTKLAVGVVGPDGGVLVRREAPTERADPWPALERLVIEVVSTAEASDSSPASVGAGCGGPMSAGGELVSPLNIPGWRDFPLKARVAALTGLPAAVDNDAKALALAEGWCGAAVYEPNYLAMVVSTGVGGGIVLDGRLLDGRTGNAGHIGHVIVEPNGRTCGCGARGCLEAEASGLAIEASTGRPPAEAPDGVRMRVGRLVGRAVASVCSLLDLPLAVVAGSVALGYGDVFFDAAQRELDERCRIEFAADAAIRRAGLGRDGPLIGGAAVARRAFG